ncbi:MAG: hypothetical protein L0H23_08560, partial [Luteimonas sp.]|nr:hypothetical protein [Luteimonas sp.]
RGAMPAPYLIDRKRKGRAVDPKQTGAYGARAAICTPIFLFVNDTLIFRQARLLSATALPALVSLR